MITVDQGVNPRTGEPVGDPVPHTTPEELDRIVTAVAAAGPSTLAGRADRLRAVGAALEGARGELVDVADAETALGPARLNSELTRARVQFELFADAVDEGSFLDIVIDLPDPDAQPAPRPDLRRMMVPIGPVAVYAASNFPFAFSVAGGDTASALAAGCPVVVKAHPGHPRTSMLSGRLIAATLGEGFAVVYGFEAGRELVRHPAIRAAGFTGSVAGGRALFDLAQSRPDPIPFYGELGSLNPTVVTPGALAHGAADVVAGFVGSYLLGTGQFCTKPGLLFLPEGHGLDGALGAAVAAAATGPLLNARIHEAYGRGVAGLAQTPDVRSVVPPGQTTRGGFGAAPALFAVSARAFLEHRGNLIEECFGPCALIVEYASVDELWNALAVVPGSLTTTVHADAEHEPELVAQLLAHAAGTSGRVVFGGWPTGVAVTAAQHHGGPWPATTSSLHTSVGTAAIRRFLRPVAYQGVPDALLPPQLRDGNPLGLPRRVDGRARDTPQRSV